MAVARAEKSDRIACAGPWQQGRTEYPTRKKGLPRTTERRLQNVGRHKRRCAAEPRVRSGVAVCSKHLIPAY